MSDFPCREGDNLRPDSDVIERVTEMLCDLAELGYYRSKEIAEALAALRLLTPADTFASTKPSDAEHLLSVVETIKETSGYRRVSDPSQIRTSYGPSVINREPEWVEFTVSPVVAQGAATPADETLLVGREVLAAALYRLEWDADLYATPRGRETERYERRADRLRAALAAYPSDADVAERIAREIEDAGAAWHENATMERACYRDAARIARSHATPPVAATEAVSGYTSHGHWITGVVQTGRPTSVARCGGPGLCTVCSLEAGMATNERHGR